MNPVEMTKMAMKTLPPRKEHVYEPPRAAIWAAVVRLLSGAEAHVSRSGVWP